MIGRYPATMGEDYISVVRSLLGAFDREKAIDLLTARTRWKRSRLAAFSDKRLMGWLQGEDELYRVVSRMAAAATMTAAAAAE